MGVRVRWESRYNNSNDVYSVLNGKKGRPERGKHVRPTSTPTPTTSHPPFVLEIRSVPSLVVLSHPCFFVATHLKSTELVAALVSRLYLPVISRLPVCCFLSLLLLMQVASTGRW